MDRKTVAKIASRITLCIMWACVAVYYFGPVSYGNPAIVVMLFTGWLQGICWGYLYALHGRLTWF